MKSIGNAPLNRRRLVDARDGEIGRAELRELDRDLVADPLVVALRLAIGDQDPTSLRAGRATRDELQVEHVVQARDVRAVHRLVVAADAGVAPTERHRLLHARYLAHPVCDVG